MSYPLIGWILIQDHGYVLILALSLLVIQHYHPPFDLPLYNPTTYMYTNITHNNTDVTKMMYSNLYDKQTKKQTNTLYAYAHPTIQASTHILNMSAEYGATDRRHM